MTSGIYELTFPTGRRYIGRSIDITKRYQQHLDDFLYRRGSEKMLREFDMSGKPTCKILVEANPDHLDILETYLINTLHPELNTTILASRINDEDWNLIKNNPNLIRLSTAEQIKMIDSITRALHSNNLRMAELEENVTELLKIKALKDVTSDLAQILDNENKMLRRELQEVQHKYEVELEKPWYKKLFG